MPIAVLSLLSGHLLLSHFAGPTGAAAPSAAKVRYQPPVDAPVVDRFRPPASPYGAGNRGIDYVTAPGTPVRASAPGMVTFSGAVGGPLHVVILHDDGVRTSYSFLASTAVARGQMVGAGHVVGTTGSSLHFGARRGEEYIDPLALLAAPGSRARLVPDVDSPPVVDARGTTGKAGMRVPTSAVAWARRR